MNVEKVSTKFECSVVIPVYNAEKYLEEAVESAVHLSEVGEVILVEDNSPDNALLLCQKLSDKYPKVKLYRHPHGENRGAGASRNLGITMAKCNFISFLDADDYYLPSRFTCAKSIFEEEADVDFTYGVAQTNLNFEKSTKAIKGIKGRVAEGKLFRVLLTGKQGFFHTNCVTIKRKSLLNIPLFDTSLRLHQDTHLWLRLAYLKKGRQELDARPTAVVRMHSDNRITGRNNTSLLKLWERVHEDLSQMDLSLKDLSIISSYLNYYRQAKGNRNLLSKLRYYWMILKVRSI